MDGDEASKRPVIYKRHIQGIDLTLKPEIKVKEEKIYDNCRSCGMTTRTTKEGCCTYCRSWKPIIIFHN